MPERMKPVIYRITHLWPNKGERGSTTAEIERDRERVWTIVVDRYPRKPNGDRLLDPNDRSKYLLRKWYEEHPEAWEIVEVVPADDCSSTVQIKSEADWPESGVLPSRFVSLQDYERLQRALREAGSELEAGMDRKAKHIIQDALDLDYEWLERERR